jgi:Lon protease-like protein
MDYVSEAATPSIRKNIPDCNRAAKAAVANMIKMLSSYGFDEKQLILAIADAVDDHILTISKQ